MADKLADTAKASAPRKRKACPTVLQMEAVECGAASLAMVLAHFGRHVPLPELRAACGVSRDGSKANNVLKAARTYGLEAKGYKKEIHELYDMALPLVVFWNFNHFLVLEGWGNGKVYLNDPALGKRVVSEAEFDQGYTGVALSIKPGETFVPGGIEPSLWPALKARMKGSYTPLLYCFVAGLLLVVPTMAVPVFTQIFVDDVLVQDRTEWLRPLLLGIALSSVLMATLRMLQMLTLTRLHTKLSVAMGGQYLWHLLRMPVGFFSQRSSGELANRMAINAQVAGVISGPLATTAIDVVMVVVYAAIMLAFDPLLTAIAVAFAALQLAAVSGVNKAREASFTKMNMEYGRAYGAAVAGLQSIETLKASGLESDFFSRWAGYYTKALNTRQGMAYQDQGLGIVPSLLGAIATMSVLAIGGWRVMDGHLSIGMLVAFQGLMGSFMAPVGSLVGLSTTITQLKAGLNRLDDVLGNAVDPQTEDAVATEVPERLSGYVELRNVSFGYSPLEPPLIENFSVTLKPGQRVAFVGGSGSGKSTIAKLVTGLFEPWSGEVLLDGVPRRQWPRELTSNAVAIVDQDLFLFSGPVRENLRLWDTTLTDQELVQACRDAEIMDVVAALPGGLDAELAENASNLSGGQRQRLEIARALARNPAVLVLDEATSALDSATEQRVDRHLRRRGCTCIIVAHRLSTIRDCDEIIVLERGKVVQRGTHDELKQQAGHYANLIQAEGGALQETQTHG